MSHSGHCCESSGCHHSSHHSHEDNHCHCHCHHGSCCDESHMEEEECDSERLLAIADMAWAEVLKEKIKEHIRASDKRIDEIAKIVSETNRAYWHQEISRSKTDENYAFRLSEIMHAGSCCCTGMNKEENAKGEKGKKKTKKGF
jgi:hypothetical protein